MDDVPAPDYPVVLEIGELVWTGVGYMAHGVFLGFQVFLAFFLIITGIVALRGGSAAPEFWRKLGATRFESQYPDARSTGALRLVAGALLLFPAVFSAPWLVTILGTVAGLAVLLSLEMRVPAEWKRTGRWLRWTALASTGIVAAVAVWERDDPLTLGARVMFKMQTWRSQELAWQIGNDAEAPKVGDLAPEFELADHRGLRTTRLADYRGKRPVALVFGSYT